MTDQDGPKLLEAVCYNLYKRQKDGSWKENTGLLLTEHELKILHKYMNYKFIGGLYFHHINHLDKYQVSYEMDIFENIQGWFRICDVYDTDVGDMYPFMKTIKRWRW